MKIHKKNRRAQGSIVMAIDEMTLTQHETVRLLEIRRQQHLAANNVSRAKKLEREINKVRKQHISPC
jgi:hypothetical protein